MRKLQHFAWLDENALPYQKEAVVIQKNPTFGLSHLLRESRITLTSTAILLMCLLNAAGAQLRTIIHPESPDTQPIVTNAAPVTTSTLVVPITIESGTLHKTLDAKLPRESQDSGSETFESFGVKVDLEYRCSFQRQDIMDVKLQDDALRFTVPVIATVGVKKFGIWGNVEVRGSIDTTVKMGLTEKWEIQPDVSTAVEVKQCEVAGVNCTWLVKKQLGKIASEQLQGLITDALKDQVGDLNTKDAIAPFWEGIQTPYKISSDPSVWLVVRPDALFYSGLNGNGDQGTMSFGVTGEMALHIGEKPAVKSLELPPLQQRNLAPACHLQIPVRADFKALSATTLEVLSKEAINLGDGVNISVKGIEVYGNGPVVVVRVAFQSEGPLEPMNTEGYVFLSGKPVFNRDSQMVEVQDLEFDVHTKNILLQMADRLLHEKFRKTIENNLRWNIDELFKARFGKSPLDFANQQLGDIQPVDLVKLHTHFGRFEVLGIEWNKDQLSLNLALEGDISVKIAD